VYNAVEAIDGEIESCEAVGRVKAHNSHNSQEAGMTREQLSTVADAVTIITNLVILTDVLSRWL
jgi:hypothetical protein